MGIDPIIIVKNPAVLSGEPVFRGTRVPFKSLTDYLDHGRSLSEFLDDFPGVSRQDASPLSSRPVPA
jgi:uncharacterized protein (DUF433 family)